jgi:transposase
MNKEKLEKLIDSDAKRICSKCKKEVSVKGFFVKKRKKINKITGIEENCYRFNSPCKECANKLVNKERMKMWRHSKIYGLQLGEYEKKLESQFNCCAICGKNRTEFKNDFDLDHNHETGQTRGLLCHNCNVGFGFLKEDIIILKSAIEYKNKWDNLKL